MNIWLGTNNEAGAATRFEPLTYTPATGAPGDGQPWRPAIAPLTCN